MSLTSVQGFGNNDYIEDVQSGKHPKLIQEKASNVPEAENGQHLRLSQ